MSAWRPPHEGYYTPLDAGNDSSSQYSQELRNNQAVDELREKIRSIKNITLQIYNDSEEQGRTIDKMNLSTGKFYTKIKSLSKTLVRDMKSSGSFRSSVVIGVYIFLFVIALYALYRLV